MFANYYHSFNKLGAFQRDDLVDALVVVEQVVNAEFLHNVRMYLNKRPRIADTEPRNISVL